MPSGTHDALPDPRNASVLIWINGRLVPRDDARISVFDSGYLVGDGIWDGLRLHHGVLTFLEMHFDRLFDGLSAVRMDPGLSRTELTAAVYETAAANQMWDGAHIRVMITRGTKKTPSQDPRLTVTPANIVIIAEHKSANPAVWDQGIALRTVSVRRPPPNTLDQRLNCHSKLHEVMALNEALEAGADEALMLDTNGHVATCNATNFFAVVGREVWTSTGLHCLPGITRANVLKAAASLGLPAREHDFGLDRLTNASEAFVTGTFGGLTPVRQIDDVVFGVPGKLTQLLQRGYESLMEAYVTAADHGLRRS
ncbi:MAG: branched-chain amino acid aminotransferase [Rhodothermales bacterium]|jgi:branched-chain amino acid aminotransferase